MMASMKKIALKVTRLSPLIMEFRSMLVSTIWAKILVNNLPRRRRKRRRKRTSLLNNKRLRIKPNKCWLSRKKNYE